MKTRIYVLLSPEGEIRYVGKTKNSLSSRFMGHLGGARKGEQGHKGYWIRSLFRIGKLPTIQLIGEVEGDGCKEEIAWISYFKDEDVPLTNNTLGGDGAKRDFTSQETRKKISETLMGHKLSKETRDKIFVTLKKNSIRYWKNKIRSSETCRKISQGHLGQKTTEETKRKMSLAHRGLRHTEEAKRKMRGRNTWSKGRVFSENHRKKLSEAAKHRCFNSEGVGL